MRNSFFAPVGVALIALTALSCHGHHKPFHKMGVDIAHTRAIEGIEFLAGPAPGEVIVEVHGVYVVGGEVDHRVHPLVLDSEILVMVNGEEVDRIVHRETHDGNCCKGSEICNATCPPDYRCTAYQWDPCNCLKGFFLRSVPVPVDPGDLVEVTIQGAPGAVEEDLLLDDVSRRIFETVRDLPPPPV